MQIKAMTMWSKLQTAFSRRGHVGGLSRAPGLGRAHGSAAATVAMLCIAGALSGCATPAPNPADSPLTGSAWALVAIQSMDDAQGTTRIADPSRYTLQFGSDGQARLLLDCNRGMGSYAAVASADGQSGALRFGPLAVTRAQCPAPSLDDRIARQIPYIRSYLKRDGKLYLSLMADGGIFEWQALPGAKRSK